MPSIIKQTGLLKRIGERVRLEVNPLDLTRKTDSLGTLKVDSHEGFYVESEKNERVYLESDQEINLLYTPQDPLLLPRYISYTVRFN